MGPSLLVSLSIPNVITIGLISLLVIGLGKMALRAAGMSDSWL
jgi:hypothetical protein